MTWSQRTTDDRIDILIRHYKTMLKNIDPNNTARMHETYLNDRARYDLVSQWDNFVRQLELLKEKNA
jgi:hypothetical protein